ncbi:phosphatidate cytidylyltransferase [Pseudoxanthomonas winnipegensis]|uniref:phosphatidate cytidylyltransferase n=1 Tax=Pseudoxanthomonas winnipegensis TaxID=2480810 RepID=UPI003CCE66B8
MALSATKRSLGAKAWGTMIEGYGGALDRLDPMVFSAPVFHVLRDAFDACRWAFRQRRPSSHASWPAPRSAPAGRRARAARSPARCGRADAG